jgi:hypothetical protein
MRAGGCFGKRIATAAFEKHPLVSRKKVSGFYTKFVFLTIAICLRFDDEGEAPTIESSRRASRLRLLARPFAILLSSGCFHIPKGRA